MHFESLQVALGGWRAGMNGSIERVVKKSEFVPLYVSWSAGKAGDLAGSRVAVVQNGAREGVGCGDWTSNWGGWILRACP